MLELKNISLNLADSKDILNDVSLNVESGKFVVITGPNGGGKSTLAKIVAGIFKPTSGQILFDGEDITNASITDRAQYGDQLCISAAGPLQGYHGARPHHAGCRPGIDHLRSAANISRKSACARATMWTVRSTQAFPAAKSSASRSPWSWRAGQSSLFLTSRRPASTCGASKI